MKLTTFFLLLLSVQSKSKDNLNVNSALYVFPFDKNFAESSQFLVFAYSLPTDVLYDLSIYSKFSLTENFNASLSGEVTFHFGKPYELVILFVGYKLRNSDLQSSTKVYKIFYQQIFSEKGMFFWVANFPAVNILTEDTKLFFEIELVAPVVVGAPSLSFHAKYFRKHISSDINEIFDIGMLYKLLQWNHQGQIVQGLVLVRLETPSYFNRYTDNPYFCPKFISLRSNNSLYCNSELMSTLYVSIVHNFTLRIRDRTLETERTSVMENSDKVEYFFTRTVGPSDPIQLPNQKTRAKMFSSAHEMFPVYCNLNVFNKDPNSNVLVWTAGFTSDLWIQIVVVLLCLSFLYNKQAGIITQIGWEEFETVLLTFIASLTMQRTFKNTKVHKNGRMVGLTIVWCVFVVATMYANSIVSVVTVPPPPKVVKSLSEALQFGFKFIWDSRNYAGATFETIFGPEYKSLGVYHLINDSSVPGDWPMFWTTRFVEEKLMFAMYDVNVIPHTAIIQNGAEVAFQKKNVAVCHTIPDSVHKHFDIWEMRVSNRRWLLLSAERLGESGLMEKWEEWANLAYLQNIHRTFKRHRKNKLNKNSGINFDKFRSPFVVFYGSNCTVCSCVYS